MDKKSKSKLKSLFGGILIGGAIGSILGLTLAPKKGKETREIIKNKGKQILDKSKELKKSNCVLIKKLKDVFKKRKND